MNCAASLHATHLGLCRCACVLVDVGLNDGSSLLEWPHRAASMLGRSPFPQRQQLRPLVKACARSNTTCYYGFEANPGFDEKLQLLESQHRQHGLPIRIFTSTAFSNHSGGADFLVEPPGHKTGGVSSTLDGSKPLTTVDSKGNWHTNFSSTVAGSFIRTRVNSMSATEFITGLISSSDVAMLKMDIEGYEYTLLPQLLRADPAVVCKLALLVVEWHERMMPKHRGERIKLIRLFSLKRCNLTVVSWD